MAEDMARALGANGTHTIEIAGKECTVRPLGIGELAEVDRICAEWYKRNYLKTWADNADLYGDGRGELILQERMEAAAKWTIDDLPPKRAHDPDKVKLTEKLTDWLRGEFNLTGETDEKRLRRLCAAALDRGTLDEREYRRMSEELPACVQVPYSTWWITGCTDGMLAFVWVCFRHNGVTRKQVEDELRDKPGLLTDLSSEIERLSAAQMGNG